VLFTAMAGNLLSVRAAIRGSRAAQCNGTTYQQLVPVPLLLQPGEPAVGIRVHLCNGIRQ
jgi:hypothetical protein